MKILFLADAVFEDLAGGSRVVARQLAEGLRDRGHEVTFLVAAVGGSQPGVTQRDGIRTVRYAGAGKPVEFVRNGMDACAKLLRDEKFDIAHTHFAYAAVGPLKALHNVKHVRTFHGPWDTEGWVQDIAAAKSFPKRLVAIARRRMRHRVERANLRSAQAVTVLSDAFFRDVVNRFAIPAKTVSKIPGGVDIDRFHPPASRSEAREKLSLPLDKDILFSVRRLVPRMGLDNLIKAMATVVKTHPQALLLIGGRGPESERLQESVRTLGLGENCRLLGFIPDDQLVSYFQAADLFVLPTVALEGFGLVTIEAMSCGTPVLGTPVGATPEILNSVDPELVACGVGPDDLAKGIVDYLSRPPDKRIPSEFLREHVLSHYRWDTHIDAIESLYKSVLADNA